VEKLQENTKKNGKIVSMEHQKAHHYGVLPKGGTKLKRSFGRKI
jgi:hypothetical protein